MKKTTYKASSDIALIKYWGKKDEQLRLPANGSISMILNGLDTITTVQFGQNLASDELMIQGESISPHSRESKRVIKHLDRIRQLAQARGVLSGLVFAKVVSRNSFPRGTGLSSSGSGMAALTYAAATASGLKLTEKELSILARQASGTACRCVCGGFVEWKDGDTSETSYSQSIFSADHWDLRSVIAIVDEGQKKISSTEGHTTASSSKFFAVRQKNIKQKIKKVKQLLADKDFSQLGELIEQECLEFHSILFTSQPPLITWYPGTIQVIAAVKQMRTEGIEAYFTINTGFNAHVITLPKFEQKVRTRLDQLKLVKKTLVAKVGEKPRELTTHLF